MKVTVLNGPNLDRLGTREPGIYGHLSLAGIERACRQAFPELEQRWLQTNHEGRMVEWIHEAVDSRSPVVLNPAAWTHYSIAVRDACAELTGAGLPLVEVHLSNPQAREEFRHHSVVAPVASGTVAGFGASSYLLALQWLSDSVEWEGLSALGTRPGPNPPQGDN